VNEKRRCRASIINKYERRFTMKYKYKCALADLYAGPKHKIIDSPELLFIKAICDKQPEKALSFFREKKLFGNVPPVVDAPYGRYEGLDQINEFAKNWLSTFKADSAFVTPVVQTRANGRSVTEMVVNFVENEEITQVPMFVVGDLRTADTLEEVRIYCHFTYVPGLTAYRRPLFQSAHLEMGDPGLLTGAVREYYEALHHVPKVDVDRLMGALGEGCVFGGYEPLGVEYHADESREELRKKFEFMSTYIPRCVGMRYETLIDDGVTCVIEWVHIVSEAGQKELGRVCLSGISAYERGEDGLLCAIRISDYAGYERTIDWSKTPISKEEAMQINFIKEFRPGVGRKPQS
jgi:hypothetical protein